MVKAIAYRLAYRLPGDIWMRMILLSVGIIGIDGRDGQVRSKPRSKVQNLCGVSYSRRHAG